MSNYTFFRRLVWPMAIGVMVVAGLPGCGNRQQEARSELSAKSFTFTVDEYMRAAREGNVTALKHFLEAGMEVDVTDGEGTTALFRAAQAGRAEAVEFLAGRGASVEVTGTSFDTALMAAARTGTVETVQALLAAGAKPEVRSSRQSWTALTAAAYRGEVEIVKVLAPVSSGSIDEALQLGCVQGSPAVVEVLLRHGADVYSRSKGNWTPLMYAAANGHEDVVRLLMVNGSNKLLVDDERKTAADLALANRHAHIIAVLDDPRHAPVSPVTDSAAGVAAAAPTGTGKPDANVRAGEAPDARLPNDVETDPDASVAGVAMDPELSVEVPGTAPFLSPSGDDESPPRGASALADRATDRAAPPPSYPRLQGASLPGLADGSTVAFKQAVRVRDFREGQLPIVLEEVPAVGKSARIRVIDRAGSAPEIVPAGGVIGDTGLELVQVERKFMDSKMGEGRLLDVSHAVVRDRATGRSHIVRRQQAVSSTQATALISAGPGGEVYEVREGDEFSAGDDRPARYRVLDVRPTQVVVENLESRETVTLARGYAR